MEIRYFARPADFVSLAESAIVLFARTRTDEFKENRCTSAARRGGALLGRSARFDHIPSVERARSGRAAACQSRQRLAAHDWNRAH